MESIALLGIYIMYECATTTWAELMSQRNRMPVKMNEALAAINTLFAYKIFFDCNQMKCLEISITNALQHLLQINQYFHWTPLHCQGSLYSKSNLISNYVTILS